MRKNSICKSMVNNASEKAFGKFLSVSHIQCVIVVKGT
jgi:hypothetical protein